MIDSRGTVTVCSRPSSSTAKGVIWLPTTTPFSSSTTWANRRMGRSPSATSPRYVRVSCGAPTTRVSSVASMATFTAFSAGAGVMSSTRPPRIPP